MKATVQPLTAAASVEKSWLSVFSDLVKARLTLLVLLTTLVGFYVASPGSPDLFLLLQAMLGTALVAAGASALNQFLEREHDAKMERTEDRPLPSGRLQPGTVLLLGGIASATGLLYLAFTVNLLTGLLGAITLGSYLFIYTPLKRVTTLNTIVGAIPGALPPLMGWTAGAAKSHPVAGRSLPSSSSGSCRTFLPLPGFTGSNMPARAMSCCPLWTRTANAPVVRPSATRSACSL